MWSVSPSVVEALEVNEVRDGLTVYDPATDRVATDAAKRLLHRVRRKWRIADWVGK